MAVQLPGRPIQRIRRAVSRAGSDSMIGALGATFIGGPALGIGVGILSGRLNAQEIDRRAEDELLVREATQLFGDSLAVQRERAQSPEDLQQVSVMQNAYEYYSRLLAAGSPALQAKGEAGMQKLLDAQLAYETRNEEQRIAREAAEAAAAAAVGQQNWTRRSGLYDDLYRESDTFIERSTAYGALRSAYRGVEEPGNIEDVAAVNALQQLIDPGVAVKEGDVTVLQNTSGVPDLLMTGINRVFKSGGRFEPDERRAMLEYANRLMTTANEEQITRNGRFQSFGGAAGLPENLVRTISIPTIDLATGTEGMSFGTPNASTQPAASDAEAGKVAPVEGVMKELELDFTAHRAEDIGSFPPDVQFLVDSVAGDRRVLVDNSGRIFMGSAFEQTMEITTTQEMRDAILAIREQPLAEEQIEEIRERRANRGVGVIDRSGSRPTN